MARNRDQGFGVDEYLQPLRYAVGDLGVTETPHRRLQRQRIGCALQSSYWASFIPG